MKSMISDIKSFCILAVLSATAICNTDIFAAESGLNPVPEETFHIVYHDNNGNIIRRDIPTSDYTFNSSAPLFFLPSPSKNMAWCDTPVNAGETPGAGATVYLDDSSLGTALSADLHLYPVVGYGKFISFDSDGGTPVPYQFILAGGSVVRPDPAPVKTGYTFVGWFDGETEYQFNEPITAPVISDPSTHRMTLKAKWIADNNVEYKINIWLEKSEHPDRSDLSDAQAHAFDDYDYGMTITKTGTSGDAVAFTSADRASNAIKDLTYFDNDHTTFPIYFYDNEYGSFAQSMSEASIVKTTVDPTGATMVDVFYRRIVFKPTIGVLTTGYDGKTNAEPSWDPNYQHPTVYMRNGELLGSALQRAIDKGDITLSQSTIDMFKTNTTPKTCNYDGFWKLTGFSGYTCGFSTSFWEGGLWENEVSAITLYDSQNYILTGSRPSSPQSINDGFTLYALMPKHIKEGNEFIRYFYEQTLDAALNNRTDDKYNGAIANPAANYSVYDIYHAYHGSYLSNGYQTDLEYLGFELLQVQDVKRNVSGAITDIDFVTTNSGGNFKSYDPAGYQLEIFYKRKSYNVSFQTGTSKVNVKSNSKFGNVFYEEPLSNIASLIETTEGKSFVIDETTYTTDDSRVLVFKGWYENAAGVGNPVDFTTVTMPCNNIQYYAKWAEKSITVSFDANGGMIEGSSSYDIEIRPGQKSGMETEPESPFPGRVMFGGWLLNGVIYDLEEPIYEQTELVAMYYTDPDNPFKITYKSGSGTGSDVVEFEEYGYLYDANASVQPFFADWAAPKGMVFKYWTDGTDDYDPGTELFVRDDVVLTAVYGDGNADIVIRRDGLSAGESAIYAVYKTDGTSDTLIMNVLLTGTSEGSVSRRIHNVEPGTYKVIETGWNWAYDKGTTTVKKGTDEEDSSIPGSGTGTVDYEETLEFCFTGATSADEIKHGESVKVNLLEGTSSNGGLNLSGNWMNDGGVL